MNEKELRRQQKANRAAVERHRATKNQRKQLLQSKYLRLHNVLEKQRTV